MSVEQRAAELPSGLGQVEECSASDPVEVAEAAGLHYVSDTMPGIARKRVGKHFSYLDRAGKPIHDEKVLERIRALGIPPAWERVWISEDAKGHIQATGRDAKGRKQYRYHTRWREVRDSTKYVHMLEFGESLPTIRERVRHDMTLPGMSREKVLATVVQLLDSTMIRIGNEEYARENQSYGLTTLQNEHVTVKGNTIHFHFRGKSGKDHDIDVRDKQLAKIVKRCQELPGYQLFEYKDEDGVLRTVDSSDVNEYLREISGHDFSAKDFRTWGGTVIAASSLEGMGRYQTQTEAKKFVVQAIKDAAGHLGNTPAICRKCYVHPGVLDAYMDGSLSDFFEQAKQVGEKKDQGGLHENEVMVFAFLKQLANDIEHSPQAAKG